MDTPKEDGGAAFPIPHSNNPGAYCAEPGMSLRDYFAAQCVPIIIRMEYTQRFGTPEHVAQRAYEYADAMLRARKDSPHG